MAVEFFASSKERERDALMYGFLVIMLFYGLGIALNKWGHVPLPGNLIGLLLLAVCLIMGWIPLERVEKVSAFLLKHLMLFFVPILVGVIPFLPLLAKQPLPTLVALIFGPILVMYLSGNIVKHWTAHKKKGHMAAGEEDLPC